MAGRIKADVVQALKAWRSGKPVRSIELGHIHRMKENPGMSPSIDMSEHVHNDQERTYAYCFHLIELFSLNGVPDTHELFLSACDEYEQLFREGNEGLTTEELDAAESLAWKALVVGWAGATEGHKDSLYIEVKRPEARGAS
jgi:hypothetical protein